jgi:predicted DsbA family dithiol-disulfide isomerase
VRVVTLPYELHPEIPVGGLVRRARSYSGPAALAAEAGLPFAPPERVPRTRTVLELSEWVRREHEAAFDRFEASVFRAYFGDGLAIDDVGVLDGLLGGAGVPVDAAWDAVAGGEPSSWVDASMAMAREAGVAGTPAWLLGPGDLDEGFLVPGVQPRAFFERVVPRLLAQSPESS